MKGFSSILLFTALTATGLQAQKLADFSRVEPGQPTGDGFFFYLPRTAAEIEFTITENRFSKGELAAFAQYYFQSNPESRNRSEFGIGNISVTPLPVPDPAQKYRYSAKIAERVSIQTVGGIIKSINAPADVAGSSDAQAGAVSRFSRNDDSNDFQVPFFSLGVKSDTVINREIRADSTIVERRVINRRTVSNTPEEMAKESVQKLDEIRKIRYTLISGPEDVMMDGQSLATSLKELEKTEQELLSLFFGRSKKVKQTYRITYIPGESRDTLFYLHPENGVSMQPSPGALPVRVSLKPFAGAALAGGPSADASKGGVIPYRTPEKMVFSIQWNGAKYFETELLLPQYGQTHAVPVKKLGSLRVLYDTKSGAIESLGPVARK